VARVCFLLCMKVSISQAARSKDPRHATKLLERSSALLMNAGGAAAAPDAATAWRRLRSPSYASILDVCSDPSSYQQVTVAFVLRLGFNCGILSSSARLSCALRLRVLSQMTQGPEPPCIREIRDGRRSASSPLPNNLKRPLVDLAAAEEQHPAKGAPAAEVKRGPSMGASSINPKRRQ